MREKLLKFAIFKDIQEEATYRDITPLIKFFNDNSEYLSNHCNEFSTYAFSYATTIIIDTKKYEWAERVANLALLAEVFAEHGYAKVTAALQRLEDPKKPHMELYLRGMYIEMRKTDNASSILRLHQKKIPCDCLDELRGIMHAEGAVRHEACNVCFKTRPKNKFLICSGCNVEEYCSIACQEKDWNKHKRICASCLLVLYNKSMYGRNSQMPPI